MKFDSVEKYLKSSVKEPYFLFISDKSYTIAIDNLLLLGFDFVPVSSFCNEDDKLPDIDELLNHIKAVGKSNKKLVVTGLGELLALRGNDEAISTLLRLKNFNESGAKVVLLLRGLGLQIESLKSDQRFDERYFNVIDKAECNLSFTLVPPSLGLSEALSFKAMLMKLENGYNGNIVVSTVVDLDNSIFAVHKISNAYEGIKFLTKEFSLDYSYGSDANWSKLLTELSESKGSLDEVFENYAFSNNLGSEFYTRISGNEYHNWIYFIYLKIKVETLQNGYLRFVLDETDRFENFVPSILNAIIKVPHTDKRFPSFYQERKALVVKFPESDIANFVVNNRQNISESIYKLTDNTRVEREEIIAWVSQNGIIPQLDEIYPLLSDYLKKYIFKCPELSDLLTEYFEAYKKQKLYNKLEATHLKKVDELAVPPRKFNRLPTRNAIIDDINKKDTHLYWFDALGVEYLGLIEALAQRRGLSIRIHIARAELPTITSINHDFFDNWQGDKEKNSELDDVKHKDKGGYNFVNNELPIHLAKELEIITDMIDKAATELALRRCKCFLVASDHGASRLAVIHRKEEKYDTDTSGEHSGRCCKLFHPYDLPFAVEENGYLVLADYGRFKGSRAANVEVHGGASLEEVVVPIIELSLKDGSVTVTLVDETVTVDFRTGTEIKLFLNSPMQDVSLVLNGKPYSAVQTDFNHYTVKLPDITRAGDYLADVYAGDDLIGKITIKAHGKSAKVDDAFDDLF